MNPRQSNGPVVIKGPVHLAGYALKIIWWRLLLYSAVSAIIGIIYSRLGNAESEIALATMAMTCFFVDWVIMAVSIHAFAQRP